MKRSEGFEKVIKAINEARKHFTAPEEDKSVRMGGSKYTYSSLKAYLRSCQEPLRRQGVEIMVSPLRADDGTWTLEMILQHVDGPWVSFENPIFEDGGQRGDRNKAFGSGSTYAWRYLLRGSLGLGDVDTGAPFIDDEGDAAFPNSNIGKQNTDIQTQEPASWSTNYRTMFGDIGLQSVSRDRVDPSHIKLCEIMNCGITPVRGRLLKISTEVNTLNSAPSLDTLLDLARDNLLTLLKEMDNNPPQTMSKEVTEVRKKYAAISKSTNLPEICHAVDVMEDALRGSESKPAESSGVDTIDGAHGGNELERAPF